jgi:hypothetical protein
MREKNKSGKILSTDSYRMGLKSFRFKSQNLSALIPTFAPTINFLT